MLLVNLGCGSKFSPDWINLDINPLHPKVKYWDVKPELPFASSSVDFVYSSHLIEHLYQDQVINLLHEIHRILKPKRLVRLVTPDLGEILRLYQYYCTRDEFKSQWLLTELFDQMTRDFSGGNMQMMIDSANPSQANFIRKRVGLSETQSPTKSTNIIIRLLGGKIISKLTPKSLQIGKFRQSGEVHRWLYDSYSLSNLLKKTGFSRAGVTTYQNSRYKDFAKYDLEITPAGLEYKPDSLYIEAQA